MRHEVIRVPFESLIPTSISTLLASSVKLASSLSRSPLGIIVSDDHDGVVFPLVVELLLPAVASSPWLATPGSIIRIHVSPHLVIPLARIALLLLRLAPLLLAVIRGVVEGPDVLLGVRCRRTHLGT